MRDRRFAGLTVTISVGYVITLAIWLVAWWALGDANWLLIALNRYALYLLLPALFLPCLWVIDRRLVVLFLVPLGIFLGIHGHTVFPGKPVSSSPSRLRVLSFNILFSNSDAVQVSELIQRASPDLVALQEVTPAMFGQLQVELGDQYRWSQLSAIHPYGSPAIFSRHPVREFRVVDLQADRAAVLAEVDFGGERMTFISAHLLAYGLVWSPLSEWPRLAEIRTYEQRRQAELLAELVRDQPGVIVMGCDCNAQVTGDSYRVLAQVLREAARPSIGDPNGIDGLKNGIERRLDRIDYQFYGGDLKALGVYTLLEMAGSDHYPVLAEYAIGR